MSVVAWDRKTLAADRQYTNCGMKTELTKLFVIADRVVVAFTGDACAGLAVLDWYKKGADPASYPSTQNTENWCRMVVVTYDGLLAFEKTAFPVRYDRSSIMAWGAGADFAMGAMRAGATAIGAVEITNEFSNACGFGHDAFTFPTRGLAPITERTRSDEWTRVESK